MRAGDKMGVIFRAISTGWSWTVFRATKRVTNSKPLFNMKSEVDPGGAVGYLKICQRLGAAVRCPVCKSKQRPGMPVFSIWWLGLGSICKPLCQGNPESSIDTFGNMCAESAADRNSQTPVGVAISS